MATSKKLVMSQFGHAAQLGIKSETQNPDYPDQISKKRRKIALFCARRRYFCVFGRLNQSAINQK